MNIETVKTTARHLRAGDVLSGSGFVVTRNAIPLTSGRVLVCGRYPSQMLPTQRAWNASTTLTVTRKVS
jgi:hypothetical protein